MRATELVTRKGILLAFVLALVVAVAGLGLWLVDGTHPGGGSPVQGRSPGPVPTAEGRDRRPKPRRQTTAATVPARAGIDRAFHSEIDKWAVPTAISSADVTSFVSAFSAVPAARQKEFLYRSLNLIPDANAELLAGLLFDRRQSKEVVQEVFRDIVNRSDEVKGPILKKIAQDKTHPCYDDVRWIYEVTGERPTE